MVKKSLNKSLFSNCRDLCLWILVALLMYFFVSEILKILFPLIEGNTGYPRRDRRGGGKPAPPDEGIEVQGGPNNDRNANIAIDQDSNANLSDEVLELKSAYSELKGAYDEHEHDINPFNKKKTNKPNKIFQKRQRR